MRSYQVFAGLAPDHAEQMLNAPRREGARDVRAVARGRERGAEGAPGLSAAPALREARRGRAPHALACRDQPIADEVLAVYFLECRKELLIEWLDLAGRRAQGRNARGRRAACAQREEAARGRRALSRRGRRSRSRAAAARLRRAGRRRVARPRRVARAPGGCRREARRAHAARAKPAATPRRARKPS